MSTDDPTRILDDASDASPRLRELFGAGREELPAPEQLEALAARLAPLFGPGDGGGGGGGSGGGGGATALPAKLGAGLAGGAKVGLAIAALAVAGVVVWAAGPRGDDTPEGPTRDPVVTSTRALPPVRAPTAPAPDPTVVPPTPTPAPMPETPRTPTHALVRPGLARVAAPAAAPAPAPAPETPVARPTEMSLLDPAQRAVRAAPARALALADEHARQFPDGTFAQERETIAIEALVCLGRRADAEARRARFHAAFPGSSHGRRVDVLLAAPP